MQYLTLMFVASISISSLQGFLRNMSKVMSAQEIRKFDFFQMDVMDSVKGKTPLLLSLQDQREGLFTIGSYDLFFIKAVVAMIAS